MTKGKTLNKAQALDMAISIKSYIGTYIENHREAYIEFLKANSLTDEQYYKPNSEADK